MFDDSNDSFKSAFNFVSQTGQSVFVTGKAGTGKTTFLKYVRDHCRKKMAITAPTGVAAINAGGVTLHSFFQLPLGLFIPERIQTFANGLNDLISDPQTLFRNIRFNTEKRVLIQELELLIIDEVSMVRADMLDAVDTILRHFRQQPSQPFGGVQMLFIGDLFQLPPVVPDHEWDTLHRYYKSPFFFDARSLQNTPPVYIELNRIYRQTDLVFINILNHIRNNQAGPDDLEKLHRQYHPGFVPPDGEHFITLTTHNSKAAAMNQAELKKLAGKEFPFEAVIKGEFSDRAFPAEKTLLLKAGAQIMFIKNDKGEMRRYFNGKIGTIQSISENRVEIVFDQELEPLVIERETWRNIRYTFNRQTDKIEEEELGSFSQYPIRLAWAITIHKSQGLTFDRAIIDAGASFAAGQVYVALSRLTSIEGLILYSRIHPHNISTDERIISFAESALPEKQLTRQLQEEQINYAGHVLKKAFNWNLLAEHFEAHFDLVAETKIPETLQAVALGRKWLALVKQQQELAVRFTSQLEQILSATSQTGFVPLQQRIEAASRFFIGPLVYELIEPLREHLNKYRLLSRIKKYLDSLNGLMLLVDRKKFEIEQAMKIAESLVNGVNVKSLHTVLNEKKVADAEPAADSIVIQKTNGRPKKGDSRLISLVLFKEGKKLAAIASLRGITASTVAGHLASFITTGEIAVDELVSADKMEVILSAIKKTRETRAGSIKDQLGTGYSFGEIQAVINHYQLLATRSAENAGE